MRLHDQEVAHRLLARAHPLRQGRGCRLYLAPEADLGEYRPVRQKLQQVFRLRRLNEASRMADQGCNRAVRFRLEQARQLRRWNEASLTAGRERNRAARSHLRLTANRARCHLQRVAGHRCESSVRVQVRGRVVLRTFRHKVAARDPHGKDSVLRRRLARVHMSVVDLSIGHRPPARLRVKQAAREKQGRALMINLADRRHQEVARPLLAGQPEAEDRRREPSAAKSSHNTERNNRRKERRGPGRNNSGVIL